MKYRNKPQLQDKLAAEYVLGTLRGRARLRFQAWMRDDALLRRAVSEWEARLAPLAAGVAEVMPPRRVWSAIQARIAARGADVRKPGFWESLSFWRGWGLLATGCAAALVAAIALQQPQRIEVPVVRTIEVPVAGMQPAYVAILHATQGQQRLVFVAYAARDSDELWVKKVALDPEPAERAYELWGLPAKKGEPPRSLGLLPKDEQGTLKLARAAGYVLADFPALAISIEPEDGSKTGLPTGPVIAAGDCLKFW